VTSRFESPITMKVEFLTFNLNLIAGVSKAFHTNAMWDEKIRTTLLCDVLVLMIVIRSVGFWYYTIENQLS